MPTRPGRDRSPSWCRRVRTVERIYDLRRAGLSASAIARLLDDEGVPHPTKQSKSWHHSHVLAAAQRAEVRRLASA
ncbi:hypothetical protein GCM10023216_02750 [Isoptericola chiayiensis]|uniref:Recombinase domain-containing protein n=1 Tax=Isoptericola chiayiensis TaxID=579446 RepID=A0ABP8XYC4_9MICO